MVFSYRHILRHLRTLSFSVTSTAVENIRDRRLNPLIFYDVTHLRKNTVTILIGSPFIVCTTIARRAYVLLAA